MSESIEEARERLRNLIPSRVPARVIAGGSDTGNAFKKALMKTHVALRNPRTTRELFRTCEIALRAYLD